MVGASLGLGNDVVGNNASLGSTAPAPILVPGEYELANGWPVGGILGKVPGRHDDHVGYPERHI